jgi:type IV pilus assembly PilN-like protein
MMARLGLELGARVIRGVRVDGWPRRHTSVFEIAYDRSHKDDAIRALEVHTNGVRRIAVAIDLPLLFTKRVKLPALSAAERRNILLLEPERFFADRSLGVVPAVRADSDLVFAAQDELLAEWVRALEGIAPVDLIEPAPVALARALGHAGITDGTVDLGDGVYMELSGGQVVTARRVFKGQDVPPTSTAPAITLPAIGNVPAAFLSAYGAALEGDAPVAFAETLVSPMHEKAITGRRRRELAIASVACALAFVFALASLDSWRTRAADEIQASLPALKQQAAPALALETELEAHAQRARAIREIEAERPARLGVLLALSRQLPPGAFVRGIRGSGSDWQLDGYAPNASNVIARLGAAPEFKNVHFLSAMDHAQVGHQSYESFALAFRFVSAP